MVLDEHDGHSRYFPDSALEVFVAGRHDEYSVLLDVVDDAIVGVGALVLAGDALEARVFRQPDRHSVLVAQLFELGDHAVGDVGDAWVKRAYTCRTDSP